jgi:hypothetical protein
MTERMNEEDTKKRGKVQRPEGAEDLNRLKKQLNNLTQKVKNVMYEKVKYKIQREIRMMIVPLFEMMSRTTSLSQKTRHEKEKLYYSCVRRSSLKNSLTFHIHRDRFCSIFSP